MSNEINNLFATESNVATTGNRGLAGTAQLTSIASNIAATIIREMNTNVEEYVNDIKSSQIDNNAMDALVARFDCFNEADSSFLAGISEETLEGMLKSQQSKRSRCKSKTMTMDNYSSMMTAAIAECFIRQVLGKDKGSTGARRVAGSVEYTIEELEQLSADQDRLRKEIRNVQSKKSIMKSKAGFSEEDERWQQLLKVEQQLKDMRVGVAPEVVEVDTTKNELAGILSGIDMDNLHAKDSKELLAQIAALVNAQ